MAKNKVLIIDDDQDMRFILERILTNARYKVFKARNGKEGIELAKKILPDIIVTDIMMPELDGITTVLKLKSIEETKSIPIIVSTAVREDEDKIVAQNLGAADYCKKTADMKDLLAKIERILKK